MDGVYVKKLLKTLALAFVMALFLPGPSVQAAPGKGGPAAQAPVVLSLDYSSEAPQPDGTWRVSFYWTVDDPDGPEVYLACQLDTDTGDAETSPQFSGFCPTSGEGNPDFVYTYAQAGTYTVRLTVKDTSGLTTTQELVISNENRQPVIAAFQATPSSTTSLPATLAFSWDVSDPNGDALRCTLIPDSYDANIKIVQDPCNQAGTETYTYTTAGTYSATFIVSDGKSEEVMANASVEVGADFTLALKPTGVNLRPNQQATVMVVVKQANLDGPVTLSVRESISGLVATVDPAEVEGDSSRLSLATDDTVSPGTYTLYVDGTATKAGSSVSRMAALVVSIDVTPAPAIADFGATPDPTPLGDETAFYWAFSSYGGSEYRCALDPGDGTEPILVLPCTSPQTVPHRYGTEGTYSAHLTIEDTARGLSAMAATSVSVVADGGDGDGGDGDGDGDGDGGAGNHFPTVSDLTAEPASGSLSGGSFGTIFHWTAADADGDVLSCIFNAGDGSMTVMDIPCSQAYGHMYTQAGTFTAQITAYDPARKASTASVAVTVAAETAYNQSPTLEGFSATPSSGTLVDGVLPVTFTWTASDADLGAVLSCAFDPGDGTGAFMLDGVDCAGGPYTWSYTRFATEEMGEYAGEWQYDVAPLLIVYDGQGGSEQASTRVSYTAPAIAPRVTAMTPEEGAENLPTNTAVYLSFNDSMNPESVEEAFSVRDADGVAVEGAFEWLSEWEVLFAPGSPLSENERYTAQLGETAMSASEMAIDAAVSVSFTTVSKPAVIATEPRSGESDVGPGHPIDIEFDQEMDSGSVESALSLKAADGSQVAGSFVWNAAKTTFSFTPTQSLALGTEYTLFIGAGTSAETGKVLDPYTLSFTTATREIDAEEISEAARLVGEQIVALGGAETAQEIETLAAYMRTLDAFGEVSSDTDSLCVYATYKSGVEYAYCNQPMGENAGETVAPRPAATAAASASQSAGLWEEDTAVSPHKQALDSATEGQVTIPSYTLPDQKTVYILEAESGYPPYTSPALELASWSEGAGYDPHVLRATLENLRAIRALGSGAIGTLIYTAHGTAETYTLGSLGGQMVNMGLQTDTPIPTQAYDAATQQEVSVGHLRVGSIVLYDTMGNAIGVEGYFYVKRSGIRYYFGESLSDHSLIYVSACHSSLMADSFAFALDEKLFTYMGHTNRSGIEKGGHALRSFFSGMLSVPYENPQVSSTAYRSAWRPFWLKGVMETGEGGAMFGAADVSFEGNGAVLAQSGKAKSFSLLLPSLGALGLDYYRDAGSLALQLLITGKFGTTEVLDRVKFYAEGEELDLLPQFSSSATCASDEAVLPYTNMEEMEAAGLYGGYGCEDYLSVNLPLSAGCGTVNMSVDGKLMSNDVPLTCWDHALAYEVNIKLIYFHPESGDDTVAGDLKQTMSCKARLMGDIHAEKYFSPWDSDHIRENAGGVIAVPDASACSYTWSGTATVLKQSNEICNPNALDPGESCQKTTEERVYTLNKTGVLPIGGNKETRAFPDDYPYVEYRVDGTVEDIGLSGMAEIPVSLDWTFHGLEGDGFPAILDASHTIHVSKTTTTTTYSRDADGAVSEENVVSDPIESDEPLGFYFDSQFTSQKLKPLLHSDYSIDKTAKADNRDDVFYRVSIPSTSAVNPPTKDTQR